jgi:hypothetical protein
VHDGKFINLLRELLAAGYMENWTYNHTLSGVPQGGVVSPLLSNILLKKLDTFVETILIPQYTKGVERRANPEYTKLLHSSYRHIQRGEKERAKTLRKQAQSLPAMDVNDPNYRRLHYVRYADDFLLGFAGPRSEAEAIKQQLRTFLHEELKLELSEQKTLITHARTEAARFLGYEITALHNDSKQTLRKGVGPKTKCRSINGKLGLRIPRDVIAAKCKRYRKGKKVMPRNEFLQRSDYDIVTAYQLEYRGIANYYRLAYNLHTLAQLKWVMEISLTKTLASKHKVSVSTIYEKYRAEQGVNGKKYHVLQATLPRPEKEPLVATWGGVPLLWDIKATLEDMTLTRFCGVSERGNSHCLLLIRDRTDVP